MSILGYMTINQLVQCLETTGRIGNDLKIFENKDMKFFITKVTRCEKTFSNVFGIQIPYFQAKESLLLYLCEIQGKKSIGFFNPQSEKIHVEKEQEKYMIFENYVFEFLMKKSQYYPLYKLENIVNSKDRISFTVDYQKFNLEFKNEMEAQRWLSLIKRKENIQKQNQENREENQQDKLTYQVLIPQQIQSLNKEAQGQKNVQIQKLINQKSQLQVIIRKLKYQFDQFKSESQKDKKSKQQKIESLEQEKQVLNSRIKQLTNDVNLQIEKFISLRAKSEDDSKQKLQKIDTLQKKNQAMRDTIEKMNKSLKEKEQILNAQLALKMIYQTQLQEQKRIIQENFLLIKQYQQSKLQEELKEQQINQRNKKISELESQINDLSSENSRYILTIQELQIKKTQLHQSIKVYQQKTKAIAILKQNQRALHIFQGNILHGVSQEKKYLKQSIQNLIKKEIQYSKLIFKNDPCNPTSFHHYVDQHPNICAVIKLKNGRYIAGFSVSPLSDKTVANQDGIICSLTEKKTYKLCEGKRSVTYDKFFLIFGNSELRLKQGEVKFFSNFGIANSFYDSNGDKYTVLNGVGNQREVIYENFEVFEVFFK